MFSIVTLMIISVTIAISGGSIRSRHKCGWWKPRYIVNSKVWIPLWLNEVQKGDCNVAQAYADNMCAWQFTFKTNNEEGFRGEVWNSRKICGRGILFQSDLEKLNQNNLEEVQDSIKIEETNIKYKTIFDSSNNSIKISNLNGYIKTNNVFAKSEFEIII